MGDLIDSNPLTIQPDSTYALTPDGGLGCGNGAGSTPSLVNSGCDLTSTQSYSPSSVTVVMKFSGTGGPLAQFGSQSNVSSPFQYFELYLDSFGRLSWGVYNYGALNVLQSGSTTQPNVFADGNPHIVVASIGVNGMRLFADGSLVASNSNTLANYATGFWLFGNANLAGASPSGNNWPYAPTQTWFNGTLYYWAWWSSQLSDSQAQALSNPGSNPLPPITNNYVNLTGQIASLAVQQGQAYSKAAVTFRTDSTQLPACGSTIPLAPSSQTFYTDTQGNLPASVNLPQGAHMNMIVGNGPPNPLIMPCQSTIDLSELIPAQNPLPDAVSSIVLQGPLFQGTSVSNPATGTIGPATLTSPGTINNTCAGGTVTIDRSLGPQQTCTMSAATTIAFSNVLDGAPALILDIITDGNSGHIPTFPNTVVWPGGTPPVQGTINGAHTFYGFINEGGTIYGSITSATAGGGSFPLTSTGNANGYSITNLSQITFDVLSPPTLTCTASCSGTCATTYTYQATCNGDNGNYGGLSASATCTNAASLSTSNTNALSWTTTPSVCKGGYSIYGRVSGSLGLLNTVSTGSFTDNGSITPGAAPPTIFSPRFVGSGVLGFKSILAGGVSSNSSGGGPFYFPINGLNSGANSSEDTYIQSVAPIDGILRNLYCTVASGGSTPVFKLRLNATDSLLTCSSGSTFFCQDTTDSQFVHAGDVLNMEEVTGSTHANCSVELDS